MAAAIQESSYYALQYASYKIKDDKEIILLAVKNNIIVFEYSLLEGYQDLMR